MGAKADIAAVTEYYADLLIQQYRDKPKARGMIKALVRQALGDNILLDIANAYTVDGAEGKQMDVVAKYVGAPRTVPVAVVDDKIYMQFHDWRPEEFSGTHGMGDWRDSSKNADTFFYRYENSVQNKRNLSDQEMRLFIKMKIAMNTSDGTYSGIVGYLYNFFGKNIVCIDNGNMTLTYYVADSTPFTVEALQAYLPRPMGVSMTTTVVPTVNGVMLIPQQYPLVGEGTPVTGVDDFETRPIATLVEVENLFEPTSCGNNWSYLHVGIDLFEGIPQGQADSVLAQQPTSPLSPARMLEGVCVRFPVVEDVEEFSSYAVGAAGDMTASSLYFKEGVCVRFPAVSGMEDFSSYAVGAAGDMTASSLYFKEGTNFAFNP